MDTEDKVKGFYGGEKWIEHKGYFLRAHAAGEQVNQNTYTDIKGSDVISISKSDFNGFSSHKHSYDNLNRGKAAKGNDVTVVIPDAGKPWGGTGDSVFGDGGGGTGKYGSSVSGTVSYSNVPRYKPVYIWERAQ